MSLDNARMWRYAVASWCLQDRFPEIKPVHLCRFYIGNNEESEAWAGHEQCEPLLTAEGVGSFLEVTPDG